MVDLGRTLSGMHKTNPLRGLDLLFWAARTMAHSMPVDVVRGLLQDPHYHHFLRVARLDADSEELLVEGQEQRYLEARGGDHLMCPFECDGCLFRKLRGRGPSARD
jgi:hypothetical protein